MNTTLNAIDITIGFHPDGYRIDKTAAPMNRYTQWEIRSDGCWQTPKAVSFHALPATGWRTVDGFDWND